MTKCDKILLIWSLKENWYLTIYYSLCGIRVCGIGNLLQLFKIFATFCLYWKISLHLTISWKKMELRFTVKHEISRHFFYFAIFMVRPVTWWDINPSWIFSSKNIILQLVNRLWIKMRTKRHWLQKPWKKVSTKFPDLQ